MGLNTRSAAGILSSREATRGDREELYRPVHRLPQSSMPEAEMCGKNRKDLIDAGRSVTSVRDSGLVVLFRNAASPASAAWLCGVK